MDFNSNKAIYLQICDAICEKVLSGEFKPEDRIPSVREYGASIGVNPNTVMRTYEKLTTEGIIYNKKFASVVDVRIPTMKMRRAERIWSTAV